MSIPNPWDPTTPRHPRFHVGKPTHWGRAAQAIWETRECILLIFGLYLGRTIALLGAVPWWYWPILLLFLFWTHDAFLLAWTHKGMEDPLLTERGRNQGRTPSPAELVSDLGWWVVVPTVFSFGVSQIPVLVYALYALAAAAFVLPFTRIAHRKLAAKQARIKAELAAARGEAQ